jgi:glyoxylase-like metal-dependent hydrolase (beta-lactamase superfamily II)
VEEEPPTLASPDDTGLWQTHVVSPLPAVPFEVLDGVTGFDIGTAGLRAFNAVYLIPGSEPALIESGSAADAAELIGALASAGVGPADLAHLIVTHIHLDHAGGAGDLLRAFPRATVWVHERGAPHLVDPTRLLASTARTYGADRMRAFYGATRPVAADRLRTIVDGQRVALGERRLRVIYSPGHASHHVALLDDVSGAVFTGEAVGSHLPWADAYRPALPPPEVDVEQALASIERIRGFAPSALITTHFGIIQDAQEGCDRASGRIRSWSDAVRSALVRDPDATDEDLRAMLVRLAGSEFLTDAGRPIDLERYDAIGSIGMNATGLARYWRKRWEREAESRPARA